MVGVIVQKELSTPLLTLVVFNYSCYAKVLVICCFNAVLVVTTFRIMSLLTSLPVIICNY